MSEEAQKKLGRVRLSEWAAPALAVAASLWFGLAAAWELFGPFGAGHVASSTAIGISADNMLRWGIATPVTEYTLGAPVAEQVYCHHPWGIFWVTTLFSKIFGHRDFVCRLAPVLWSAATPPLLYAIGRRAWSPAAGAIAALTFAVLPISLAFANFNALEVPVIFGILLATWGYLELSRTWRARWLWVSLAGILFATNSDWPGFVFVATVLGGLALRVGFFRRYVGRLDVGTFFRWWLLAAGISTLVGLGYVAAFSELGKLNDFLQSGEFRAIGSELPLSRVLAARKDWIYLSFTSLGIALGVLALPFVLARLVLGREPELFVVAVFVTASVQYVVFKQGADIHVFWPQYFAAYLALALGSLTDVLGGLLTGAFAWLRGRGARWGRFFAAERAPLSAFGLVALVTLSILPDGARALGYARGTGLRFDERGYLIHQDIDKTVLVKWLMQQLPETKVLRVDPSMKNSWSLSWAAARPVIDTPPPVAGRAARFPYVLDSRFVGPELLRAVASSFAVRAVGPYWVVKNADAAAPFEAFRLARREPGFFEWYFLQGTDPVYAIEPDAFSTWELRAQFGQLPNPPPKGPARDLDELRVLHNFAIESGDAESARKRLAEITGKLKTKIARDLPDGVRLLGYRLDDGVAPLLTLFFLASGPTPRDAGFMVQSVVDAPARLSWTPVPERQRAVGMPFDFPSTLWRPGWVYVSKSEIRKRPGRERFYGYFRSRPITGQPTAPEGAREAVELFTLE
jgi:4-amino-4-deoxy-L-arabinose transferase-like glycosyltransferase